MSTHCSGTAAAAELSFLEALVSQYLTVPRGEQPALPNFKFAPLGSRVVELSKLIHQLALKAFVVESTEQVPLTNMIMPSRDKVCEACPSAFLSTN